jgi:hypothetical protein
LAKIPVEDDRFDLTLSSQALEHMPDPLVVLSRASPSDQAYGSHLAGAPLFFEEHQPDDFYRLPSNGFTHLAAEADLDVQSIDWLEAYTARCPISSVCRVDEMLWKR